MSVALSADAGRDFVQLIVENDATRRATVSAFVNITAGGTIPELAPGNGSGKIVRAVVAGVVHRAEERGAACFVISLKPALGPLDELFGPGRAVWIRNVFGCALPLHGVDAFEVGLE